MTNPTRPPAGAEPLAQRRHCGAKTRSGKPCKTPPVTGGTRCRMHGGATPRSKAAAKRRTLEARIKGELEARGWEPVTDPVAAYADLAGEVWTFKEVARDRLAELTGWVTVNDLTGTDEVRALVEVYERALERAQKTLADMLRIGLTAEHLRQAREQPTREQADTLIAVMEHLFTALNLTPEQRAIIPQALPAALAQEGLL